MAPDLTTTNVLLGIMAAVSVLEALAVVAVFVAGYLLYRQVRSVVAGIEERQVAPAATRVNAILDDVKSVSSTIKEEADRLDGVVRPVIDWVRRAV